MTRSLLTALLIGLLSCGQAQEKEGPDAPANEIVDAARSQVGKTTIYDGSYVK